MAKNNRTADRVQAMLNMIGGDDVLDALLSGRARLVVEYICCIIRLLPVVLTGKDINLSDFFKDRKGLMVSPEFTEAFLSKDLGSCNADSFGEVYSTELLSLAHDGQIRKELPSDHVFENPDHFLICLATLIDGQLDGGKGHLNEINIFFVKANEKVSTAIVHWSENQRSWVCHVDKTYRHKHVGTRVFSAATMT